jgi:HAD superfamily hydrolase (TIGR01509 family)
MRTKETVEAILRDNGLWAPPDEIAALARRKSELALAWIAERNPVAPAARSVLEHLAGRYSLALATSASPATVACFLERNGLRSFFGPVLTGAEVLKAKPDPEIYLRSASLLGVPPSACLVIEDAVAGVKSAKAAGSVVCALAGVSSREALRGAGADFAIDDLEELMAL